MKKMEKDMNMTDIINVLQEGKIKNYLEEISQVHAYTKHYLLIAEEISEEGVMFLQPMKEHRDAYDHLMRVFFVPYREIPIQDKERYIEENIKKAFGHEYRSFFDTADWLTYICRKYVRERLETNAGKNKYIEVYGDEEFELTKKIINEIPYEIAEYRENKDVGSTIPHLVEVLQYKKTIDNLLEIYNKVKNM